MPEYQPVSANDRIPTPQVVLQALLGEASDCAAFGISVYDDDGRLVTVNEHAASMLGETREDLLTRDVGDFTEGGIDRSVLLRTELREGVRLVQRRDGSRVPVAFVVAPTRVAGLGYFVAVSWELPADDPRARDAR
jgi:PAS domain S-box-containing protein